MNSNIIVSVATIIYNNAEILETYIRETIDVLSDNYSNYELVLINNGSMDSTDEIVKGLLSEIKNIRFISLSRIYDEEHARTAALDHCIGDFVVLMDINFDPPALIPKMIDQSLAGYDLVIAERSNRHDENFLGRISAKLFYKVSEKLTGYKINPNESDFVVFSRKMVNSLVQIRDRSRYLKYMKLEVGFKHATIKYDRIHRNQLKKNRNFLHSVGFALEMITTNSDKLLRMVSLAGFLTSFLNLVYVLYILLVALFKKNVAAGWVTTSLFNSSMFFLLFLFLSIISVYISSILKETKKGPLYYISDESNSSVIYKNIKKKNVV